MKKNYILIYFLFITAVVAAKSSASVITPVNAAVIDSSKADISAGTDSINISQMVQAQIDAARQKDLAERNKPVKQAIVTAENHPVQSSTSFITDIRSKIPLSDDMLMKLSIIGTASALASGIIITRRKRGRKKSVKHDLKTNIKLLREEKIYGKPDGKLSSIRNKLVNAPSTYELSNKAVARNARELNISKEEIYLAARIKSHEMSKAGRVRN